MDQSPSMEPTPAAVSGNGGESPLVLPNTTPAGAPTAASPAARVVDAELVDGILKRVDPAYRDAEALGWWILTSIIALGSLVGAVIMMFPIGFSGGWWLLPLVAWAAWTACWCWMAFRFPMLTYERTSYAVSSGGMEIRKGVWWRRVINVPKSRVQHTDVAQGPIARRFGISVLRIHTAGTENSMVELHGLKHETALRIRDFLIRMEDRGDAV